MFKASVVEARQGLKILGKTRYPWQNVKKLSRHLGWIWLWTLRGHLGSHTFNVVNAQDWNSASAIVDWGGGSLF